MPDGMRTRRAIRSVFYAAKKRKSFSYHAIYGRKGRSAMRDRTRTCARARAHVCARVRYALAPIERDWRFFCYYRRARYAHRN